MALLTDVLKDGSLCQCVEVPFLRYRIAFCTTSSILLPPYSGSTIRGAFGRSLRRTSCMTHQTDCKACPLYRTCPYTQVFETPPPDDHVLQNFSQIPNAYVIEPPKWGRHVYEVGEPLVFDIVLMGRSRSFLPLIIYSLRKAFAYDVGHGKAELTDVFLVSKDGLQRVYGPDEIQVLPHLPTTTIAVPSGDNVTIRMETPMRLQSNGVPLGPDLITPHNFLTTLLRRVSLLLEFECGTPLTLDFKALVHSTESVALDKNLGWKDWQRYSSRQNQKMSLGGVVGTMKFSGLAPIWRVLLAAGQLVHVGKNTTFGLGKYTIQT